MTGSVDADRIELRAAQLRSRLVEQLTAEGSLRSPAWKKAFNSVPRHVFVPAFFRERDQPGKYDRINRKDEGTCDPWLRSVYTDDVLFTQVDDEGVPTSSSTTPGLMALMLEALDIKVGMKVLEIGTGTGYNAALLSSHLGSEYVTSIDIDRELVDTARERLASLGYFPQLAVHDGMTGYLGNAPYDRIISTVAVPAIPDAWIRQVSGGGRILANFYRELGGGALASLSVNDNHAKGRFLPDFGGFMPIRAIRPRSPISLLRAAENGKCRERATRVAGQVLDDPSFAFLAAFFVSAQQLGYQPQGQPEEFWLLSADGSWAKQTSSGNGELVVCQHGPHLLWDALEQAHQRWTSLGVPPREDFGLTVAAGGAHTLWHKREPNSIWVLACQ